MVQHVKAQYSKVNCSTVKGKLRWSVTIQYSTVRVSQQYSIKCYRNREMAAIPGD